MSQRTGQAGRFRLLTTGGKQVRIGNIVGYKNQLKVAVTAVTFTDSSRQAGILTFDTSGHLLHSYQYYRDSSIVPVHELALSEDGSVHSLVVDGRSHQLVTFKHDSTGVSGMSHTAAAELYNATVPARGGPIPVGIDNQTVGMGNGFFQGSVYLFGSRNGDFDYQKLPLNGTLSCNSAVRTADSSSFSVVVNEVAIQEAVITDSIAGRSFANRTQLVPIKVITSCRSSTCSTEGPQLCGRVGIEKEYAHYVYESPCADSVQLATALAIQRFTVYRDSVLAGFDSAYISKCLQTPLSESLTMRYPSNEYHYTLYYYDQAGNLIKTLPPEAVVPNRDSLWLLEVTQKRQAGLSQVPGHNLQLGTIYRYNSLNQVVSQRTPEAGLSIFWYDRLGRLTASQNHVQRAAGKYSYTRYDFLGRILETGQKGGTVAMTKAIARDSILFKNWLAAVYVNEGKNTIAEQVVRNIYDVRDDAPALVTTYALTQRGYTVRNRVSATRYHDVLSALGSGAAYYASYDYSTTYFYDIHGNVDTLLQQYRSGLMSKHADNKFKLISYKYDLISGKVNEVHYQPGQRDQFFHRYAYDGENRLTQVYTTDNKLLLRDRDLEETEARYDYYLHGPLARTVIGQQQVQQTEFAYTLQGWLRGMNARQQSTSASGPAEAAVRFGLQYHHNDYLPINAQADPGNMAGQVPFYPLYNGNIAAMATGISAFGAPAINYYRYDQLNRLTRVNQQQAGTGTAVGSTSAIAKADYREEIQYDGNGNILRYLRNGTTGGGKSLGMDSLLYRYQRDANGRLVSNKLYHINDNTSFTGNYSEDIDDQGAMTAVDSNYAYDAIGNLIKDKAAKLSNVSWSVYGKIRRIDRSTTTTGDAEWIAYSYDAMGNRIGKEVKKRGIGSRDYSWYVRDASGNIMATYSFVDAENVLFLDDQSLYGSNRLGTWSRRVDMDAAMSSGTPVTLLGMSYVGNYVRGNKFFELSNHLGNVLATVSDKKTAVNDPGNSGYVLKWLADVHSAQDYYAFGMLMPGRSSNVTGYKYGFNGKENDNEVKGTGNQQDYGMRIYDPRIGKFLSVDPIAKDYPGLTPYQFASNRPIDGIDQDGLEYLTYIVTIDRNNKGSKVISQKYVWYNANQHNAHGSLGQGVQYRIRYYNSDEKKFLGEHSSFVSRGASTIWISTEYGNYMGATSLFKIGDDGNFTKTYEYSLPAVDMVDNLAKNHDIGYDKLGAVGANSLFGDWGATPVDEEALNGWNNYLSKQGNGSIDPFSGQSVNEESRSAARRASMLFSIVVGNKKNEISSFMQKNYSREAKRASTRGQAIREGASMVEFNYQLFLDKYMEKDSEGNWTRKDDMWKTDKRGNWSPVKP